MSFENTVANCLTLLDSGATEDECLARYPEHAEQLAPLLRIAAELRNQPAPLLSSQAFARGRAALRAEAQQQQMQTASHRRPPPTPAPPPAQQRTAPQSRWRSRVRRPQPRAPRLFSSFHLMTTVLAAALVLMSTYTLIRSTGDSLPGDHIYEVKRLGENVEGALMNVAGQSAAWHMQQAERRLHESLALEMRGQAPDPTLTASINTSVQSALNASWTMSSSERATFLAEWLTNLQSLQLTFSAAQPLIAHATEPSMTGGASAAGTFSGEPSQPTKNEGGAITASSATLSNTIETVETAAEDYADPQLSPPRADGSGIPPAANMAAATLEIESTPESMTTPEETATDTATPTATATNTPEATETPTFTPTPHPTATYTPTPHPTATPTWTAPTSTNTPTRASSGGSNRATKTPRPTDTPTPLPPNTSTPTPSPTATASPENTPVGTPGTPEPTGTGTPSTTPDPNATAEQTPSPSGTPSTTPDPNATTEQTPSPSGTPGTPGPSATPGPTSEPEPSPSSTADPSATAEPLPTSEEATTTPLPEATATATAIPGDTPPPTEQVVTATAPSMLATPIPTTDATEPTSEPTVELDEPTPTPIP